MAVDFSLLPPEQPEPDDPPSLFVWTVVFFALALAGVFATLLLWSKNLPTDTWKFRTTLILFPVGIPALLVLRLHSRYEGRKESVEMGNEAAGQFNNRVFDAAAIPLALIAGAYRFSATQKENTVEAIRTGSLKLDTKDPIARDGEQVKARWLVVPGVPLRSGSKRDDRERHCKVATWLFDELLDELASQIQTLHPQLDLVVHLLISNRLTFQENEVLWNASWQKHSLRHASRVDATKDFSDFNSLDRWLDQVIEGQGRQVRLIVAVQLHPLLSSSPPAGAAEAGVALLLMPDALAGQHDVTRTARLYRPVRAAFAKSNDALSNALKWAGVVAAEIPSGWQTGLDATQAGALREPAVRLGLTARPSDLDQSVGYAGVAAPWLAVACAAESLTGDVRNQIILARHAESVDCAVLSAPREPA